MPRRDRCRRPARYIERAEQASGEDDMSITVPRGVGGSQAATIADFERRREIVRHFFNDFWTSTDDNPRTFAERLNRAEDHINERLAARAEGWQLDATTGKQLGLLMPDRIVCNSPNRRWAFEGGAHGEGLNNSQYSRMCDASTPSVLLRPNLVRTKSRIWAGLMMLTTWSASYNAHAMPRL